jgi:hypothetical protein
VLAIHDGVPKGSLLSTLPFSDFRI